MRNSVKLLLSLATFAILSMAPVGADQVVRTAPTGQPQGSWSQGNGALSGLSASTPITFSPPITHLSIWTNSTASTLYINLNNGTATTADAPVYPGGTLNVNFSTPITAVTGISPTGTGNYGYAAN